MRQQILAVVGGNFYYEVPTIIQIAGHPVIWWNRGEDSLMLLNVRMLSTSSEPRATQAPPDVKFPLTVVEVQMEVANTPLSFSARESRVGGGVIRGSWMLRCQVGICIE